MKPTTAMILAAISLAPTACKKMDGGNGEDKALSKEPLSADAMKDLANTTMQADKPSASLDDLVNSHPTLPKIPIASPLQHHRCWAVFAGEDELDGSPDMNYLCVSDDRRVYYPWKEADFDTMLAREDRSQWGDQEYIQATKLYIHLLKITRQHAGWAHLNNGTDFLALTFNMTPASLPERETLAAKIQPAKRVSTDDKHVVNLFTWTLIGGHVQHWTVEFTKDGVAHTQEKLGRFGGGGYD